LCHSLASAADSLLFREPSQRTALTAAEVLYRSHPERLTTAMPKQQIAINI